MLDQHERASQPERSTGVPRTGHRHRASLATRGRAAVGRVLSGLVVAVVLAVVPGCALPIVETDDGATPVVAGTSRSEGESSEGESSTPGPASGAEHPTVSGQPIRTPCWSYEGPEAFVNNVSTEEENLCHGALELWGEVVDGAVVPTGVGAVYGQVSVEPVRVATSEAWGVGTDLGGAVDLLADSYFAENGSILSLHEATTLDGVPANITRVEGSFEETRTKAFITAFAPERFASGTDEVQFFVIAIVTPYDNGDELIEQVTGTWTWS